MALEREEQEQVEELKEWWKSYGTAIIVGVVLGSGIVGGTKYYRHLKIQRAVAASDIYERVLHAGSKNDRNGVSALVTELGGEYSGTPYYPISLMLSAKMAYAGGDKKAAILSLEKALEAADQPAIGHAARLKLGRLYLEEGNVSALGKLLQVDDLGGFASEYEELRGDFLVSQKKLAEAGEAYKKALKETNPQSEYGNVLRIKLSSLGL